VAAFSRVIERCDEQGVQLILLSGANPSAQLPLSRMIQRRGDILSYAVGARIADRPDIIRAFNWPDRELSSTSYWSEDRLHMNSRGHHRVAARVLTALGMEPPAGWWSLPQLPDAARMSGSTYYREHLGPWVRRRLTERRPATAASRSTRTGRSSSPQPSLSRRAPSRPARRTGPPGSRTRASVCPIPGGAGGAAFPRPA
jgi:hypothetical protein